MKRSIFFLIAVASFVMIGGCGGAVSSSDNAQIRFIHLVADGPALDVFADFSANPIASGRVFKEASDYQSTKAVAQNIDILVSGTSTVVDNLAISPGTNEKLSLILVGSISNPQTLLLGDNTAAPATGNVKLRILLAAPSLATGDIYITAPGDPLPSTPNFDDYDFATQTGYLEGVAASYRVRITGAGNQTVLADSGTITLAAGDVKTLVLVDKDGGGTPLQMLLFPH